MRTLRKSVLAGLLAMLLLVVGLIMLAWPVEAAFPGTNGKIAFTSSRDGDPEIFVMNADGSNQIQLTFNTATDGRPTWSPDGSKIAFDSNITGDFEIYVMDKDGSNLMNITQTPSSGEFQPAWSADGSEIAFVTNRAGGLLDIYKINADATGPQTPLAMTGFQEEEPAWAPDNSKIVYRRGDSTLFTMNSDGTGQAQLPLTPLPPGVIPRSPSDWSPDAQKIAFGGDRPGTGFQVFVSNANGTGVTELTAFPGNNYFPAFSPDGTKIAFTSDRDGNNEIYVMNANGSGQTNLTNNPAIDGDPDWQPSHYAFSGFFQPVDNPPALNSVNAGRAIPIKFSLGGNQGLSIFASGYPKSQQITCDSTAPSDSIEQTVTAGSSSLSYDATTDQYTYVWKTDKAWANTCRQLIARLNDGTDHVAHFNFTK